MTIGGETHTRARAVPRARHPEPDRVRGHLRPARGAGRSLPVQARGRLPGRRGRDRRRRPHLGLGAARPPEPRHRASCRSTSRSRARCTPTARRSPTRSRSSTRPANPGRHGLADLEPLIQFGASPRASLGLVQAARALALLRGRTHATDQDVRDLAADVLRHRLVLSYDALADGVEPDALIDRLLDTVEPAPEPAAGGGGVTLVDPPGRQGPGPVADEASSPRLDLGIARRAGRPAAGRAPRARGRHRHRARAAAPLRARRRPAPPRSGRERADRHPPRPPARARARADHLGRRSTSAPRWRSGPGCA